MRRDRIVETLKKIRHDIVEFKVVEMLRRPLGHESEKQENSKINLEHIQKLFISFETFDEEQKGLAETLDISDIYLPTFWQKVLNSEASMLRDTLIVVYRIADFLENYAPKLIFTFENVHYDMDSGRGDLNETITIVLPSRPEFELKASDLANIIGSLESAYESLCKIDDIVTDGLQVIALDSGSDKVLVFAGLGDGIEKLKEFIIEIWDRISLGDWGRHHAEQNYLLKSLNGISKVAELTASGALSHEDGERVKRKLLESAKVLVANGVISTDLENRPVFSARQLTFQTRALLSAPVEQSAPAPSNENLSSEDKKSIEEENQKLREEIAGLRESKASAARRPLRRPKR